MNGTVKPAPRLRLLRLNTPTAMFGSASVKPASMPWRRDVEEGRIRKAVERDQIAQRLDEAEWPDELDVREQHVDVHLGGAVDAELDLLEIQLDEAGGSDQHQIEALQAADHADLWCALTVLLDLRLDGDQEPVLVVGAEQRISVRIGAGQRPVRDQWDSSRTGSSARLPSASRADRADRRRASSTCCTTSIASTTALRGAPSSRRKLPMVVRSGAIAACTACSRVFSSPGLERSRRSCSGCPTIASSAVKSALPCVINAAMVPRSARNASTCLARLQQRLPEARRQRHAAHLRVGGVRRLPAAVCAAPIAPAVPAAPARPRSSCRRADAPVPPHRRARS